MTKPRLIISNYDDLLNPYYAGGGAVAVHQIAKRLTPLWQVTVITAKYPNSTNTVIDDVKYVRIGLSFVGPFLGQVVYKLILPFYAISTGFDIWLETFGPPFTASCLPLFTRKPVIGLVHMLSALDMQRKYKFPILPRLVETLVIKLYSQFIVLSESARQELQGLNPTAQVHVIPNGVDIPPRQPVSPLRHILFLGRLEINQKGLDLLLRAYKLLLPHRPLPLIIAGPGSPAQVKSLNKLISHLGISHHVTLTGKVSGHVKDRLYRQAVLVVVPSRFESFSLTALEALSYGKPLVCYDIPGLKWIPAKYTQKAQKLTSLSLCRNLLACLNTPPAKKREQLERTFARRFDWNNIARAYQDVIGQAYLQPPVSWSPFPNPVT